ncbi:1-deoxy-D-xylulose-5-phosphate synthase [uncultured Roseburia sp.]|uniref:1-deoxy-D-xylulose-5-phosphate synthase n=1 Tax=Brotonthovivens ammoniilytica TaxID=2981725 RepID=A0ABT2TFP6_9FIRM|nr:1-deoxy-D-xylulose-5-phosphate synthase [Brotonthovivens ammoniilytica]MCU6761004.1 1-deoxy-D-xylulose-5-phosphate synthase [Brotonthovivens ammoniilytica]SCI16027.1 1-deoxy-D-xylulose-5-phosphate synthase [uncultured Roseburia sp.]
MAILDKINQMNDIKDLNSQELNLLAEEIRQFLVEHISVTGGHLASNLGAVELTMALHLICNFPKDKLIWDVGHQSYTHKILTGRKNAFDTLRQFGGLSGFPKRSESACDSFNTGHSSTSISAGLGFAEAREILGEDYKVISVIGDGAFTGGMAYEALNNASRLKTNFIIVLNDNKMSISENVGGFSTHLAALRTAEAYQDFKSGVHSSLNKLPYGDRVIRRIQKTKSSLKQLLIPGMMFENLGVTYLGPVDGHNIEDMLRIMREAVKVNGAVVVHVLTEKGKGYTPAERYPAKFHGTAAFDIESGQLKKVKEKADYTDVFSSVMKKIGDQDPSVVAVTAAMADGTGLKRFRNAFPDRFFDVGIAEGHAVTFSAGLAAQGLKPVFAVYSSFLQRGFDQIVHDVCMQKLPVTFAIDRAGLVGADGETHQGIFDLSYLSMMPGMTVMAPKNKWELAAMLRWAVNFEGPVALRYSRGQAYEGLKNYHQKIALGKSEKIYDESQIALFAVGNMMETAVKVHDLLKERGYDCTLVNARFVKPLDTEMLFETAREHLMIATLEDNVIKGGYGESVMAALQQAGIQTKVEMFGIRDCFVEQGSVEQLRRAIGLDAESVTEQIIRGFDQI